MSKSATPRPYSPNREPASFSVHANGGSLSELKRKLSGAFKAPKGRRSRRGR